jgi:hypothetical protein
VIYQCPDRAMVRPGVCFGCTEDLSAYGARLLLPQAVTADRFWVRLPGRERDQAFVECQVQWRECCGGTAESQSQDKLVRCGVQFERLLSRKESTMCWPVRSVSPGSPLWADPVPFLAVGCQTACRSVPPLPELNVLLRSSPPSCVKLQAICLDAPPARLPW